MNEWTDKTMFLIGEDAVRKLAKSHVALVGVGGVGAYVAEFLGRAGVGHLTLLDGDEVSLSNCNRQILATRSTLGQPKVEVMDRRLHDINPEVQTVLFHHFLQDTEAEGFVMRQGIFEQPLAYDIIVDAIDTVPSKVSLLASCHRHAQAVVSAMGAAGKYQPDKVVSCDISETKQCSLARSVRKHLAKLEIHQGIPVVFSPEVPDLAHIPDSFRQSGERLVPGTISYMPAVFACHLASYVIQKLVQ